MRATTIIYFFAVSLLIIIPNGTHADELETDLEAITKNGETIDGIFKPLNKLGSGYSGVVYRGQFLPSNNKEIVMKFYWTERYGKKEYKMYTYLNAIKNPNIVAYGIPSICYFGEWKNNTMMGMTLHDTQIVHAINDGKVEELQLLILTREFVRIIKYVHSRGIIHYDTGLGNMAFENGQGIVFDFDMAKDMTEFNREETIKMAKHDFHFFLQMIFPYFLTDLPKSTWSWIGLSSDEEARLRPKNWETLITEFANQAENANQLSGLRRVLVEFAKHANDKHSTEVKDSKRKMVPFYDQLYQVICDECEKLGSKATSSVSISSIPDPFKVAKYDRPEVKYNLFEAMYADIIKRAREAPPKPEVNITKTTKTTKTPKTPKKEKIVVKPQEKASTSGKKGFQFKGDYSWIREP